MPTRSGEKPERAVRLLGVLAGAHAETCLAVTFSAKSCEVNAIGDQKYSFSIDTLVRDEYISYQARTTLNLLSRVRENSSLDRE